MATNAKGQVGDIAREKEEWKKMSVRVTTKGRWWTRMR